MLDAGLAGELEGAIDQITLALRRLVQLANLRVEITWPGLGAEGSEDFIKLGIGEVQAALVAAEDAAMERMAILIAGRKPARL